MELNFELIVSFLLVLIIVLVVALVAIQRFSLSATKEIGQDAIDKQAHAFPPEVLSLIGLLLGAGTELAKRTPTDIDDKVFATLVEFFGYVSKTEEGKVVLTKAPEPAKSPPPAAPEPAVNG